MNECIHGMNPDWCANCKKLLTPEEETLLLEKQENEELERFLKSK